MITLALSKGRIFEELLPFLAAAGIRPLENPEESRKLMIDTNRSDLRIVVLRPVCARGSADCPLPHVCGRAQNL